RRVSARPTPSISPLAIFGDFSARLVRRTASPRTATPDAPRLARHRAFHRSPFSAISALGSSVGRPHLARPRPTRLGSHDTEHFTARLVARRASARTTPSISPLASPPDASRLARHRALHRPPRPPTRLGSHDTEHSTPRLPARPRSSPTTASIPPLRAPSPAL